MEVGQMWFRAREMPKSYNQNIFSVPAALEKGASISLDKDV